MLWWGTCGVENGTDGHKLCGTLSSHLLSHFSQDRSAGQPLVQRLNPGRTRLRLQAGSRLVPRRHHTKRPPCGGPSAERSYLDFLANFARMVLAMSGVIVQALC